MEAAPRRGDPIRPLDWLEGVRVPGAQTTSGRLGWVGLEAVRCRAEPAFELEQPALTHHWFVQFVRPPQDMDLRYEGVKRHLPPAAGAISLVPAGSPARWRWSGHRQWLHVYRRGVQPGPGAAGGPAAGQPGPAAPSRSFLLIRALGSMHT